MTDIEIKQQASLATNNTVEPSATKSNRWWWFVLFVTLFLFVVSGVTLFANNFGWIPESYRGWANAFYIVTDIAAKTATVLLLIVFFVRSMKLTAQITDTIKELIDSRDTQLSESLNKMFSRVESQIGELNVNDEGEIEAPEDGSVILVNVDTIERFKNLLEGLIATQAAVFEKKEREIIAQVASEVAQKEATANELDAQIEAKQAYLEELQRTESDITTQIDEKLSGLEASSVAFDILTAETEGINIAAAQTKEISANLQKTLDELRKVFDAE